MPLPRISVLITFGDPRQHPDHVATWTRHQTMAAAQYEVIVVVNRDAPIVEAIRGHLRPTDQLLLRDNEERYQMYQAAVEASRGNLLVFTEDHCLARPRCLEMVAEYFEKNDADGASVNWGNINRSVTAAMDEKASIIAFENAPWNKAHFRAFVLRRPVLDEVGGFPGAYGPFGEAVLAARLHQTNRKIDIIEEIGVDHINAITFDSIYDDAYRTIVGECDFITTFDRDFCDQYFDATGVLAQYPLVNRGEASAVWSAAWRELLQGQISNCFSLLWQWLPLARRALKGRWLARLTARLSRVWARFRFALGALVPRLRFQGFWDYWRSAVACARADFFARNPPYSSQACNECPLEEIGGLYQPSTHEGIRFRWSPPVATFPVRLPAGKHQLGIDTAGFRGHTLGLKLWIFWNGRPVPTEQIDRDGRWIRVTVQSEGHDHLQPLIVIVPPLDAPNDPRPLGLPMAGFTAVALDPAEVFSGRVQIEPEARNRLPREGANMVPVSYRHNEKKTETVRSSRD